MLRSTSSVGTPRGPATASYCHRSRIRALSVSPIAAFPVAQGEPGGVGARPGATDSRKLETASTQQSEVASRAGCSMCCCGGVYRSSVRGWTKYGLRPADAGELAAHGPSANLVKTGQRRVGSLIRSANWPAGGHRERDLAVSSLYSSAMSQSSARPHRIAANPPPRVPGQHVPFATSRPAVHSGPHCEVGPTAASVAAVRR